MLSWVGVEPTTIGLTVKSFNTKLIKDFEPCQSKECLNFGKDPYYILGRNRISKKVRFPCVFNDFGSLTDITQKRNE